MAEPIVRKRSYWIVYVVLLALTLLTVLLGYLHMGEFNMVVAIAIATIQASLIAGFFMHALYEAPLVRVVAAGGVIWFLIMMTLTLTDYHTRGWLPFPGK
jgi:cytochrome c oxidase subunit IV